MIKITKDARDSIGIFFSMIYNGLVTPFTPDEEKTDRN